MEELYDRKLIQITLRIVEGREGGRKRCEGKSSCLRIILHTYMHIYICVIEIMLALC